jgi:DNA-binding transcriptional ArsR family regulator
MDDEAAVARVVGVLAAVSESTRLRLVALLAREELCLGDVQARLGLPQPLASFHLARRHYYALDPGGWAAALAALRAVLPPIPRTEGALG